MPTVLLIRHAQASFGGSDYDVLSERGREQAAVVAEDVALRGLVVDQVTSGPPTRQRDTAGPIAAALGCGVTVDPRWDEYSADDVLASHSTGGARLERPPGSTAPAVSSRDFQAVMDPALSAWVEAGEHSPAAEPYTTFVPRVTAALADVLAGVKSGKSAIVTTSGGVIAAVCVALLGLPAPAFVAFNRVAANTGVTKIVQGRSGTSLVSFNEHAHLERDGRSLITYR
jgi:broad specificity phosphatase PhoE